MSLTCFGDHILLQWTKRSMTPRWSLTPLLLRPHVWCYPRITVSMSHENTSKYVDRVTLFQKTWTKGHWPLDDLWPQVCWGQVCDFTQGSLCPSPMKIYQSMWIQRPFCQTHVCWDVMCDSTQGSLSPSPMGIHQCMWIQWSICKIPHTTYIHTYTYIHTMYRMSDHIVSFWTQFRGDKNRGCPDDKNTLNKIYDFKNKMCGYSFKAVAQKTKHILI